MADDEQRDLNVWGWDESVTVQRSTTICADAAEVLNDMADELGASMSQIDAQALHFAAMLIVKYGRPGEALVHLLKRAEQAMERWGGSREWPER